MPDEVKQEAKQEPKQEEAKAPEAAAAPKAEAKAEAKPIVVVHRGKGSRPKQCTQCSKNLKKKTWYYRSNKYFCNKRCWKASTTPKEPAA